MGSSVIAAAAAALWLLNARVITAGATTRPIAVRQPLTPQPALIVWGRDEPWQSMLIWLADESPAALQQPASCPQLARSHSEHGASASAD